MSIAVALLFAFDPIEPVPAGAGETCPEPLVLGGEGQCCPAGHLVREAPEGPMCEPERIEIDKDIAVNAGVIGTLGEGSELDAAFGSAGLSADIAGGIGGLLGPRPEEGMALPDASTDTSVTATLRMGEPIILGALPREHMDEVIAGAGEALEGCYVQAREADPALGGGKVVVKLTVSVDGSVSKAATKASTLANPDAEACLNEVIRTLQFQGPEGGGIVIASYPFVFAPGATP